MDSFIRSFGRTWTAAAVLGFFATTTASQGISIPAGLKDKLFQSSKHERHTLRLAESDFLAVGPEQSRPLVAWPSGDLSVARDREQVRAWLDEAGAALGHGDFEPRFLEAATWRGADVWVYELVHEDHVWFDARVEVHWADAEVEGLFNDVPRGASTLPVITADAAADPGWVYYTDRSEGAARIVRATLERELLPSGLWTRLRRADGELLVQRVRPPLPPQRAVASFTEYPLPQGTFPDQIDVAGDGLVWLSQPSNDWLTSFDPVSEQFNQHTTTGASGPDGMIVGPDGLVWTGAYFSGHLGRLHPTTFDFDAFVMPYPSSRPAIPLVSASGSVWVTDHERNRISEFDPVGDVWLGSEVMPSPNVWVVAGTEDVAGQAIYFTEYFNDALAKKPWSAPIEEISVPGSGPAFAVYSEGFVYYSLWNSSRFGSLDVTSGAIVEYDFPVGGEPGGPVGLAPNGHIAIGTRGQGYIMVYEPAVFQDALGTATGRITPYKIPTNSPGLKDGLTVGDDGVIWFTESNVNKLAKLELP